MNERRSLDRRIIPAGRPLYPPDKSLNVLLVDPNANTPPYDRALGRALAEAGCRVELLTSRFQYEELGPLPGVRVREQFFHLAGSGLAARLGLAQRPVVRRALKATEYPVDWLLVLARLARQPSARQPDLVHVQWSVQPSLDLLLWRILQRRGIPLVYTVHNLLPHHARRSDAAAYGPLYRTADALIVHSERSADALQSGWGVPAEKIVVVPHGPLLEAHDPLSRAVARRQLGLPLDAEIVLFAGLIEPYKGLGDLIAAFGLLAARRPGARLVVAGKPNEPFEGYAHQLQALGLHDRTTLDLRFLPESLLSAYLCAADVVALPYRATTASGLLFAARRFGRAVVATTVGDLAEVVEDGESGLLAPPASPDALAVALERCLADPLLADRLGSAGQAAALGPESWTEAARRTLTLYRRVLNTRGPTDTSFRRGAPIR